MFEFGATFHVATKLDFSKYSSSNLINKELDAFDSEFHSLSYAMHFMSIIFIINMKIAEN